MEMADRSDDEEAVELLSKKRQPRSAPSLQPADSFRTDDSSKIALVSSGNGSGNKGITIAFLFLISVLVVIWGMSEMYKTDDDKTPFAPLSAPSEEGPYRAQISPRHVQTAKGAIDSAMSSIHNMWRVDEYPIFKSLLHIPSASWTIQTNKLILTILSQSSSEDRYSFVTAFTGSSVTAGHDNLLSEMYSAVFDRRMQPVFAALNMTLEVDIVHGTNTDRSSDVIYFVLCL